MAVAMMYPDAKHGGSRQAGSSSATELEISNKVDHPAVLVRDNDLNRGIGVVSNAPVF